MNTREAIVLAGGFGTRLQTVLPGIPKCMAPVNGKPFLTYVFDYLIRQGINKVVLSVGYRKDHIINYFEEKYHSITIKYAIETEPLGTGGAVKLSFEQCLQDQAFVVNGDTFFVPDLQEMEKLHFQSKADLTIAVKHLHERGRYGSVQADENGRINDFKEKEPEFQSGWINGGIYLINRSVLDNFPYQKFSLENDVFKVFSSRFKMQAFQTGAVFLDIGIPEDYAKAHTMITMQGKE